jgi:hypothetical protein
MNVVETYAYDGHDKMSDYHRYLRNRWRMHLCHTSNLHLMHTAQPRQPKIIVSESSYMARLNLFIVTKKLEVNNLGSLSAHTTSVVYILLHYYDFALVYKVNCPF